MNTTLIGAAVAGAVVSLALLVAYLRASRRARALAEELELLRAVPRTNEYRVDRFDLSWYPVVSFQEAEKLLVKASPGVPYCKTCSKPLASKPGGGWVCAGCGNQRSDTVADTAATDSVLREAILFFLQRHPEYRLAPELQRLKAG